MTAKATRWEKVYVKKIRAELPVELRVNVFKEINTFLYILTFFLLLRSFSLHIFSPRIFCYRGALSSATCQHAHSLTFCLLQTPAVPSSHLSHICHFTLQLQLALTPVQKLHSQEKHIIYLMSTQLPLLIDWRHCSSKAVTFSHSNLWSNNKGCK